MIKDAGNAFYANDSRFFRAVFNGFTQANTDKGVLYYTLAISGGTATITFYKWPTSASADIVASGSASVSSTTMTEITLAEQNSSDIIESTVTLDLRSDTSDITDGKIIVTFSFDDDFKTYEKKVSAYAVSDEWEGEGVAGCNFVRIHRAATVWAITRTWQRIKGQVNYDSRNLPDLFEIDLSLEDLRDAAVNYGLSKLFWNQKNTPLADEDPHAQIAMWYEQKAESRISNTPLHLDINGDGKVDNVAKSQVGHWG